MPLNSKAFTMYLSYAEMKMMGHRMETDSKMAKESQSDNCISERIRSISGLAFKNATLSRILGRMAFISMGSSSSDSTDTNRSALMASSSIITIDIIGFRSSKQWYLYNK